MNYQDIAQKSAKELDELVREQREALRATRFAASGMGSSDVKKVREAKRVIAWALTAKSAKRGVATNSNQA